MIDAGYKDTDDMDGLWLHLYVMLSRATCSQNLLVVRAPDLEFLKRGPPKDLADRLRIFNKRTRECRVEAEKLARELGLSAFLHD